MIVLIDRVFVLAHPADGRTLKVEGKVHLFFTFFNLFLGKELYVIT